MLIHMQSIKLHVVDSLCTISYLIQAVCHVCSHGITIIVLDYKRLVVVYTNIYPQYVSILVDLRPYDVQIRALTHQVVH